MRRDGSAGDDCTFCTEDGLLTWVGVFSTCPPHGPRPWWLGRATVRGGEAERPGHRTKDHSGEDIIVAGGGVVLLDDGRGVEGEDAENVDAPADALAAAATTSPGAAFGMVLGDGTAGDCNAGVGLDEEAASESVAADLAIAAACQVHGKRT